MTTTMGETTMAHAQPHPTGATSATSATSATVRVSLREIREVAYRALVSHGACPGRAPAAAAQVLEAELHHGAGLLGLLADLAGGPWDAGGLDVRQEQGPGGPLLRADSPDAGSALRVGQLVADLAAAAGPVHVPALREPWPLLAGALLSTAAAEGRSLAVVRVGLRPHEAWIATPGGALTPASAGRVLGAAPPPPDGTVVLVVDPPPDADGPLRQRRRRRREAARDGLLVDAVAFDRASTAARAYLVPER